MRAGGWGTLLHGRLHETTVGVIGFGRIGRAVAKRCLGFNMDVLVADPVADADTVARLGYRLVDLDELLRQSDFVSLHAPLTPETRHLIDARRLALMKPGAILVNTARGGLVDEAALDRGPGGRPAGRVPAWTCSRPSPCPTAPLRRLDQVVLTPHVGGHQRGLAAGHGRSLRARTSSPILRGRDPGAGLVLNPEVLPAQG